MSNENNPALPVQFRAEVQQNLDRLNPMMDEPLSQIDVAVGGGPGLTEFRLQNGAEERVVARVGALRRGEAVIPIRAMESDEKPKKGKKAREAAAADFAALAIALAAELYEACKFFAVPVELEAFVEIARTMGNEAVEPEPVEEVSE